MQAVSKALQRETPKGVKGREGAKIDKPEKPAEGAFAPQVGRASWGHGNNKEFKHSKKTRLHARLLCNATFKDSEQRLDKAVARNDSRRAAEERSEQRANAPDMGPFVYALAGSTWIVSEREVLAARKVVVLCACAAHPCEELAPLALATLGGECDVVVMVQVTPAVRRSWVRTSGLSTGPGPNSDWREEASLRGPGPVAKPLVRMLRSLGGGIALAALGADCCALAGKVLQDAAVANACGRLVLVQPDAAALRGGSLDTLKHLPGSCPPFRNLLYLNYDPD